MRLLARTDLLVTGPVDHAEWNYRPVLGFVSRSRFSLVDALLPPGRTSRILEIGYGSGIFMPHLATKASALAGIDAHDRADAVAEKLRNYTVTADLRQGSAAALPFEDGSMDVVVSVSAVEFVDDLPAATREIRRVLAPGGCFVLVMPGSSPLLDLALRLATGESAKHDYGDRRPATLPTLLEAFTIDARRAFPRPIAVLLPIYHAYRLVPRAA